MDPPQWVKSISVSCRPRMPRKADLEAFREFLQKEETRGVALALQLIGYLDRRLDVSDVTWSEIFQTLIFREFSFVSVDELCRRFYQHGFQHLSKSLYICFLHAESILQSPQNVKRSVPVNKKAIHIYFKNLKRLVHNAQFKNPREFFRKQARLLQDRIERETVDESKRQFLADKFIALLGAEIDAIAITYDATLPDQDIFSELKSLTAKSTDASISEVVFYGRKANALAIAKKFSEGEDMVKQAHCCANFTGPCLEIANMIYIDVYFKLWQFEQTPTSKLKESLLYEGSKGLWALSEEEEDIRNLWKRMFLLRMIFCLLGLSNKGRCIPQCIISEEDVERAERYILEIDLENIEARREMMYYIAKARIQELKGLLYDAKMEIDKASEIAHSGNFKEVDSIEEYKSLLRDLDQETEAKTVISVEHEELAGVSALLSPSLEQIPGLGSLGVKLSSLEPLESTVSFDAEETFLKQNASTAGIQSHSQPPESEYSQHPLGSDISMETSNYSTWSVLGGQFQSVRSLEHSDLQAEHPDIFIEAVQETCETVHRNPRLAINDSPRLENPSPLWHEDQNSLEPVQKTSQYPPVEIKIAPNLKNSSLFDKKEDQNPNAGICDQERGRRTNDSIYDLSSSAQRLCVSSFSRD